MVFAGLSYVSIKFMNLLETKANVEAISDSSSTNETDKL